LEKHGEAESKEINTVCAFIHAINHQDVERLTELMSEDHEFIDPGGTVIRGRTGMADAWKHYYEKIPDYFIRDAEFIQKGNIVAIFGKAGGTVSENGELPKANQWEIPAAWRAEVRGEEIAGWRIYVDYKPVREILRRLGQL
jgi:ketosteroid isomerase-like protein